MKDFLFGWLTKGQYEVSVLDNIVFFVEFILLGSIIIIVKNFIDDLKKGKDNEIK